MPLSKVKKCVLVCVGGGGWGGVVWIWVGGMGWRLSILDIHMKYNHSRYVDSLTFALIVDASFSPLILQIMFSLQLIDNL